jgi:hypothetical protein
VFHLIKLIGASPQSYERMPEFDHLINQGKNADTEKHFCRISVTGPQDLQMCFIGSNSRWESLQN